MAKGNPKIKSAQKRPGLNTPAKRAAFEAAQQRGEALPLPQKLERPKWALYLTDREYAFVREYLVDFNGTRAAERAGLGRTYASNADAACKLRRMVHVAQAIDAAMAGSEGGSVRARVADELAAIAFHNPRNALSATGRAELEELTDAEWLAIKKVKESSGKQDSFEVEMHDKVGALEKLGRAAGLFNADKSGNNSVAVQVIIQRDDAGLL